MRPTVAIRLCIMAVAALSLTAWAAAQDANDESRPPAKKFQVRIPYDGPEIFARLLDHAGLKPIESLDGFGIDAPLEKTILIVFGDPNSLVELEERFSVPGIGKGLGVFLKQGGSLLIATDRPFSFDRINSLNWGDAQTTGHELISNQNFQDKRQCPTILLGDIVPPIHPIFADIGVKIATNCPRQIAFSDAPLRTLAFLPKDTMEISRGVAINGIPPRRPYIAADLQQRALLIAGHGLFTNFMVIRDDIGNRQLALNTINWLKGENRTHVLFINENKPVTNFKLPLTGPPRMPTPTVELVNRVIDQVQSSGILQKVIDRTIGGQGIVRGLVLIATLLLLLYGIKKFFQNTWRLESTPAVVGAPPPKISSLVKQQVRELAVRQQFGEPAQALARDWLRTYAHVDFTPGQMPAELTFDVRAGLVQRRKLAKHLTALWKLATEPSPANWDSAKFRGLAVFLEELSLATADGEVVFRTSVR